MPLRAATEFGRLVIKQQAMHCARYRKYKKSHTHTVLIKSDGLFQEEQTRKTLASQTTDN